MYRLNEPSVITSIIANKQIFEPFGDLVDCALRNLRNDLQNNTDSFAQQENDEVQHILSVSHDLQSLTKILRIATNFTGK